MNSKPGPVPNKTSAKKAWVFTHGRQGRAWHIGHVLKEKHHFDLQLIFTGEADFKKLESAEQPDLLVVMGGPMGVYDKDKPEYNYLNPEIDFIGKRLSEGKPMLGICLGAQLMATSLGGTVYNVLEQGMEAEIGWSDIQVNDVGRGTPVRHYDHTLTKIAQYHQDTMILPSGAELLASSDRFLVQAFRYGNSYGLQFHAEGTQEQMDLWARSLDQYSYGKKDQVEQKKQEFRGGIQTYLPNLQTQTELFLDEILAEASL